MDGKSMRNKYLVESALRYSKFNLKLDPSKLNLNGFPVAEDKFDFSKVITSIINLNELSKFLEFVSVYSLNNFLEEGDTRNEWNRITQSILRNPQGKYVFIFNSGHEIISKSQEHFEVCECVNLNYCHSRLLRDFIKKNKIGFEVDLGLCFTDFQIELSKRINMVVGKIDHYEFENIVKKIIYSFNKYFPKAKLSKKTYSKYLTDFYSYNLNSKSFKYIYSSERIIDNIKIDEVNSGHELYGSNLEILKLNEKQGTKSEIKNIAIWQTYLAILSDLTKLLVYYTTGESPNLLVVDDHSWKIKSELDIVEEWIGKGSIRNKEGELIATGEIDSFFKNVQNDLSLLKIGLSNCDKHYDFILIDLDYEGEDKGFKYLRVLRKIKSIYDKPFAIVFSRKEDAESVQKALNMGALFVASKQNFAHLLLELYKVLPTVKIFKEARYSMGQNWTLLYQLPLSKILELKNSIVSGESYHPLESFDEYAGFESEKINSDLEYTWIKKLPKAELHAHIGSILGHDLIPMTALLVLSQKYHMKQDYENIEHIFNYILPVLSDPFLFEEYENKDIIKDNQSFSGCENERWFIFKKMFIADLENQYFNQSIFSIITDSLNLKANSIKPEEVLLSPDDKTLEKYFQPLNKIKNSSYFNAKSKLHELGVSYEEVMLFFVLLLNIRQFLEGKSVKQILDETKADIKKVFLESENEDLHLSFPEKEVYQFSNAIEKYFNLFLSDMKIKLVGKNDKNNILQFLISAHSKQRCLLFENRGLFNYLRGCEYGGSPHLQSRESIFLAANYIIFKYACKDNIRYIDLRCAIDGYKKFKIIKDDNEACKALIDSFSHWQNFALKKTNKKIHVNIIVTAKRHKSIKEFEDNVKLTVDNYPPNHLELKKKKFFENDSRIVSFDIAGIEKNNRVSKFTDQLKPLLKKCIPTTMHAGEEDSHEAIWEAIFLAHTQRLGHALTLVQNPDLINLVRETRVNVELCPVSNYLTNDSYTFNREHIEKKIRKEYPLKRYLEERLSVSINTDNPCVSGTDLSKEFLFAARISGGLTKWEILKIILNSFKAITIHKNEKSELLKEINEEIYELMLKEPSS